MATRTERLSDRHFEPLARLFGRVFGRDPGAEHLRRKYDTAYLGVERICHVAMAGERAVAFSGMIPQRFRLDGEEVLVAQACDYATDPAWRGQGLHRELEDRARVLAVESGARLIYALLTDQSLAVARRTGWTMLATMRRYHLRVRTVPAARLAFRLSGSAWRWYCRHASAAVRRRHPPADHRANSLEREGWLCQSYDEDLRGYRTFSPNHRITLGGGTAWIKLGPQLLVGDLDAPDAPSVRRSLGELSGLARRIGATQVGLITCPGTRLDAALRELLAPEDSWVLAHLGDPEVPVERFKVNLADYDTF